jgi:phosphatidylglycerophosphate synthase
MKVSIDELKKRYLETKANEKGWIWTYYVRRPISYYLAIFFLYFDISANKVTLLFIFTGIIGSLLLAVGDYTISISGALLIELAIILDCVDGNIARVKRPTVLGNTLDTWGGEIILVLSMSMLGIGLSVKDDLLTITILREWGLDSSIYVYIGFFAALSTLGAWAAKNNWQVIIKRIDGLISMPRRNTFIIENIFHYSGAYSITMLVFAVLNLLDIFLSLVFIVYTINLGATLFSIVKRARELDNNYGS